MRGLVTGATGYVGFHLTRYLASEGWEMHAAIRPESDGGRLQSIMPAARIHRIETATSLREIVAAIRPTAAFHLAASRDAGAIPDRVDAVVEANLLLGTQIAEAICLAGGGMLVSAGSYWEFGETGDEGPRNLYAATKRAFAAVLDYYARRRGLRSAHLVLHDVYGPGDWRGKLLPTLAMGTPTPLALTAGEQVLKLVHVDDVCRAFQQAAHLLSKAPEGRLETWVVDGGEPMRLREIVALLERSLGRPLAVRWGERPYAADQIFNPAAGASRLPGWRPLVSLDQGLRRLAGDSGT